MIVIVSAKNKLSCIEIALGIRNGVQCGVAKIELDLRVQFRYLSIFFLVVLVSEG